MNPCVNSLHYCLYEIHMEKEKKRPFTVLLEPDDVMVFNTVHRHYMDLNEYVIFNRSDTLRTVLREKYDEIMRKKSSK